MYSKMEVTLIFGSNLGDRKLIIQEAIKQMEVIGKINKISSMYETAPWGFDSKEAFYNQVVTYITDMSPESILQICMETEKYLGRKRTSTQYSSRTIDIDILFYDSIVLGTPALIIPHPRITERNFVLVPLNEVMPNFIHPVTGKKISEHLIECPDKLAVMPLEQ